MNTSPEMNSNTRFSIIAILALYCSIMASLSVGSPSASQQTSRPNVLFIAIDDLRPEFGAYGAKQIFAPNLDRFANESLLFENAFCMVATCGASRASMMTSVRPTAKRFATYHARADVDSPWATPMNAHFKNNGYYTASIGKVLHVPEDSSSGWSQTPWRSAESLWQLPENLARSQEDNKGPAFEISDTPDENHVDGIIASKAIEALQNRAAKPDEPFFLAVGFHKPHLPFVAPKKYFDLYPKEMIQLPDNYKLPENMPAEAMHNFGELRTQYTGIPAKGPLSDSLALDLIRGYYACVSFADAQVGKVLDELKRLGLDDTTIVVIWGDHGWNLGDHTFWCKHSTFESSQRIPLIIRAPGFPRGVRTAGLTESIDIYPTLCELANLPTPSSVEGKSFEPLMRFPQRSWADSAVSRFGKGDTLRTAQYRYTEYRSPTGAFLSRMLYDLSVDPLENYNIAEDPQLQETITNLSKRLSENRLSTYDPTQNETSR